MKTPFQQFQQGQQKRQHDMGGYAWMKEKQRQEEMENQDFSQYPQKKSGGFSNIIWILTVGFIIYYVFFAH